MKNYNKRKALLLAIITALNILAGCGKKREVKTETTVQTMEVSRTPGLYDSEFRQVLEIAKLKSDSPLYDSGLRFERVSYENEIVSVISINDNYSIVRDAQGNTYVARNESLEIIDTDVEDYYAVILNDTNAYTSPLTYDYEHNNNVIPRNELVLVIRDFGDKLYILDEHNNPYIIREIDTERLPNSFIEIDISEQRLRFYENNNVTIESPIVTGMTGGSDPTPTYEGYYQITNCRTTNKNLKDGAHVDYWMPFIGDLFGIHDASWRYGNFGGNIYQYDGSHGCVNMPYEAAKELYENTSVGTRVLIHK